MSPFLLSKCLVGTIYNCMSNYRLNNVRRFITHIEEDDYWDMHLNEAFYGNRESLQDNPILDIETNDPNCINGDELLSLQDYFYEGSCSNGLHLDNIGYTGVDNGLITFNKFTISNEEFYKLYTSSTYSIGSGDTRLHLHKVGGNAQVYDYPTTINEDGSIKFNGGFYQGFFRSGDNYGILPSELNSGEEWVLEFGIRRVDYQPESQNTLNDRHPNNKGIFFYVGTRAENKWIYLYDSIPLSGTPFGVCSGQTEPDFNLIQEEIPLSAQTYDTSSGLDIFSANDGYFFSDNKFLLFDRTRSGITANHYDGNEVAMVIYKTHSFSGNLFTYMDRTKSGYTANDIDSLVIDKEMGVYDDNTIFSDIDRNAFALIMDDDGSVGYRYLVRSCTEEGKPTYEVLSGKSFADIVPKDEWVDLKVKVQVSGDKMKLLFYVNGKLKYITSSMPKLRLHNLDEVDEKQEGVAYNISLGGGTQGLAETIMPEYELLPTKVFPIEENFSGSFIGDIRSFRIFK